MLADGSSFPCGAEESLLGIEIGGVVDTDEHGLWGRGNASLGFQVTEPISLFRIIGLQLPSSGSTASKFAT
jgi:hypothetical protein